MTKVEDLKRVIVAIVADANFDEEMDAHRNQITLEQCKIDAEADVDLLISASHAEGVEEGVEETLAKIREVARPLLVGLGGVLAVVSIPASVLAPTKEKP
jgi:DNA-binding IclR family transcriptional regulator